MGSILAFVLAGLAATNGQNDCKLKTTMLPMNAKNPMAKRRFLYASAIAILALPIQASFAYADDWPECIRATGDSSIAACSAIPKAGPETAVSVFSAYNNRGIAYRGKGDYDAAIKDFDRAIAYNPRSPYSHNNRCATYRSKKYYDLAIKDCDAAIGIDPKYGGAYFNRGLAYQGKGTYDKAIKDYDTALALDPQDADVYYTRGFAYADKNDHSRAIEDYDRAIALNPKHANALVARGYANEKQGNTEKAAADYLKGLALQPEDAAALDGLLRLKALRKS